MLISDRLRKQQTKYEITRYNVKIYLSMCASTKSWENLYSYDSITFDLVFI